MHYITIDIETTGLDVTKESPIQMAMLVTDERFRVKEEICFYIKQHRLNPKITEITGITLERLLSEGIPMSQAANNYHSIIWRYHPVILIGYNILNFDFPMIQNWLVRNIPGRFKHPPLLAVEDVMFYCCQFFGQKKWPKLADAGRKLSIEFAPEDLHDAMADVRLTWEVWKKIRVER